jgi:hypothetical protein
MKFVEEKVRSRSKVDIYISQNWFVNELAYLAQFKSEELDSKVRMSNVLRPPN